MTDLTPARTPLPAPYRVGEQIVERRTGTHATITAVTSSGRAGLPWTLTVTIDDAPAVTVHVDVHGRDPRNRFRPL